MGTNLRGLIRRGAASAATAIHRARRMKLGLPPLADTKSTPSIYFLNPDFNRPSGGMLTAYRHVDILNAGGISAVSLHQRKGFRCTWFENSTRISHVGATVLSPADLLVVSEIEVDVLSRAPSGMRFAIFNQSGHMTWLRGAEAVDRHYRSSPDLQGVVVVSDHSRDLLSYAFPSLPLYRIHLGIDPSVLHARDPARLRRICYMPRRGREDAKLVFEILRQRNLLDGWSIMPLDQLPHSEVARALRTSRIFLSFSYQEGFGLPVAEAMACGNYVVAYHAYGGRELLKPEFSACIDPGDVLALAQAVEQAIVGDRSDDGWCLKRGELASRYVHKNYSLTRERDEVIDAYTQLLAA